MAALLDETEKKVIGDRGCGCNLIRLSLEERNITACSSTEEELQSWKT